MTKNWIEGTRPLNTSPAQGTVSAYSESIKTCARSARDVGENSHILRTMDGM